jgi:hypothetical protein
MEKPFHEASGFSPGRDGIFWCRWREPNAIYFKKILAPAE